MNDALSFAQERKHLDVHATLLDGQKLEEDERLGDLREARHDVGDARSRRRQVLAHARQKRRHGRQASGSTWRSRYASNREYAAVPAHAARSRRMKRGRVTRTLRSCRQRSMCWNHGVSRSRRIRSVVFGVMFVRHNRSVSMWRKLL